MPDSSYIVYVDESGDHGLQSIDKQFPVFVLAFCIFRKVDYVETAIPALEHLKFKHFGHDMVVLHEREIRKASGPFSFLVQPQRRQAFMSDLSDLMEATPMIVIASVIDKLKLKARYSYPENPYHVALGFGLERLSSLLELRAEGTHLTHVICESRGKKEDGELELEFRRICSGQNIKNRPFPFEIHVVDKRVNCSGLQLADLIARPIGRKILNPDQPNRAYDIIEPKFYRSGTPPVFEGRGLKVFP